jgi:hypothetical protein
MTEKAYDGDFVIPPERETKVDANSDLEVSFNVPKKDVDKVLEASIEWRRVNLLLQKSEELAILRAQVNAIQVDLNNKEQIQGLRSKSRQVDNKVGGELLPAMEAVGLDNNESIRILSGAFDGKRAQTEPYANLARWLKLEIERLRKEAAESLKNKKQEVTVQAFLDPVLGNRKALHVEGYDNLPIGELRPIDRTGLKLTSAEQQRLGMEIKQAESAVQSIREIKDNGGKIKLSVRKLLADLGDKLNTIEQNLKQKPQAWVDGLDAAIKKLETIKNDRKSTKDVKSSAGTAIDDLKAFQADVVTIESALNKLKGLKSSITNAGVADLENILLGDSGILTVLVGFSKDLDAISSASMNWGGRFDRIQRSLRTLGRNISEEQLKKLLPSEVESFFDSLTKEIPNTINIVKFVADFLRGSWMIAKGTDTLSETKMDGELIFRGLEDLPKARIELERAGLTLGDRVTVNVRFRPKSVEGSPSGEAQKNEETQTYKTQAALMGLHREIGADVIFARGYGNDNARKWKPNVAARADWHYLIRSPVSQWQTVWNWLDPGLGLHVASLDQGSDNVEIGMGASFSLWRFPNRRLWT